MLERLILLIVATIFTGCSSPSPTFSGVAPVTYILEGWDIDVYLKQNRAQAIRTNTTATPSIEKMERVAVQAIERASQCSVVRSSLSGDANVINATISC